MPKHRRKKNQRKNKGNKNGGGGSNKGNKQEEQQKTPGGADLGKATNEIATGTSPEIEIVDDIRSEYTQTIERRSPSAGRSEDESKIAHDKSDAGDNGKTLLESEQLQSNFANFSDICGVTESLENANENHLSKTGAQSSTERKAGEPSKPVVRELVEIRKNDYEKNEDNEIRISPTSTSLSSSDSDTIKAEDSPEREVPNVVEFESHDMHDVTNEKSAKDTCTGENVREVDENSAAGGTVEESKSASSISSLEGFDEPSKTKKPVKHHIVQEVITTLYSYRVESPKPMQPKAVKSTAIKKSRSLDDDDLMIQEMSDNSSAGDLTDNQPLVSEAESEAESSEALEVDKTDPRILSITTVPLDSPEANTIQSQEFASSKRAEGTNEEGQDFKSKRAKKRNALEAHFMPQFLNPRYLDSIKEECSDISDTERKSNAGDRSHPDSPSSRSPDDAFPESPTIAKKADAIFPKSNLDFSHKHKPVSHLRPPKTGVIREEPPCVVVEAKIVEQDSVEESCSTWTTDKVEESGAAEIVYLDSASSSSSDLMDLDYTQGNDADVEDLTEDTDVHIKTPTIEVDGEGIFNDSSAHISEEQQNRLPQKQREENLPSPPPVMPEIPQNSEVIEKPPESCDHRRFYEQSASEGHVASDENFSKDNSTEVVDHSINFDSSTSECSQVTTSFKIGEPCSNNMFASLSNPLVSDKENVNKFDSVGSDAVPGGSVSKELSRQDSSGSHGSGQSQSTVHSQCTAINKDSLTHSDVADIADIGSCVSGSFHEEAAIQSLRQLCIEVVASMPYGKVVLEELASVAQSLSHLTEKHQEKKLSEEIPEMPYPLPDLPHIKDLEVSTSGPKPAKVKLVAVPPQKPESPIPPPVPELPKEDSWLGVPTKKDPNLLVCLSPSQRNYMKETNTFPARSADSLLDMHQKFVERRGYHELTTDQVNAVHNKKADHVVPSTTQLRNSVTPPPVPPPPLPQSFTQSESAATLGGDGDDRNNHRLLAIIRDSKQSSSENSSRKIEQEAKPTSVSVSRAQCSDQETQTTKSEATTTLGPATSYSKQGKLSEDSVQGNSTSNMSQAHFDRENFFSTWDTEKPIQTDSKRFSNIETTPKYCGQIMQTMPKRYSNIETSSYESRKKVENGQVVYDYCDSKQEKFSDFKDQEKGGHATTKSEIMSDAKLDTIFGTSLSSQADQNSEFSQVGKNSNFNNEKKSSTTNDFSYDEFRQRAKETAKNAKNEFFKREHLLKDFEDIEKILTDDMFTVNKGEEKRRESKSDMWAELEKKVIQQEHRKEEKTETKHYENVDFANKTKVPNDLGKSNQVFQQEHKEHKKETRSYEIPIRIENSKTDAFEELGRKMRQTERQHSFEIPKQSDKTTDPWDRFDQLKRQFSLQNDQQHTIKPETREIPIKIENNFNRWEEFKKEKQQKTEQKPEQKVINIPVKVEKSRQNNEPQKSNERVIPVKIEEKQRPASTTFFDQYSSSANSSFFKEHKLTEKRLSSHNLDEWMKHTDLGASSENITKPFMKEMEIVYHGKRGNIRAPRLTASTSNLHTVGGSLHSPKSPPTPLSPPRRPRYNSYNSAIDQTPITQYVTPHFVRQCSLPRDLHNNQAEYIKQKEQELQTEFDRLEKDRRKLIEEMDRMHTTHQLRKDLYQHRSCRLPTLSEEEAFRQQMHDEWMSKVAEREERRLHKIIKISKPNDELASGAPEKPVRKSSSSIDISDEFLKRVKERRSKLQMPSDSDWESGAESHPTSRTAEQQNEPQPSVKVIEGQQEADLKRLPKHLREFAELTSKIREEHSEESSTQKTMSTMSKKEDYLQVPGSTSQPKLATILRRKGTTGQGSTAVAGRHKKQTRFALSPNRRSWSESDLLKEIDSALSLAKGFLYGREPQSKMISPKFKAKAQGSASYLLEKARLKGVWTPGTKSENIKITKESNTDKTRSSGPAQSSPTPPPPPPLPVWSPEPSPTFGKKEFRPIKFESPVLQRRYVRTESNPVAPPWWNNDSQPFLGYQSSSCSNINSVGTGKRSCSSTSDIPQKVKDNTLRRGASYTEAERPKLPKDNSPGILRPNEVIFSVKHEYLSEPETENERPKKMAQLGRRQFEGIGPTTKDGMPIVLRSEVKENNQHQWYKRMYNTLHKAKDGDEYVTIRYKTRRGRYPYKSNGYMSEPEPNYDSDYSSMKYSTLDRRRAPSTGTFHDERNYGTMPNPVRAGLGPYKNQPGRIENYVPGHSSVSEKEKKEWWDEVMDIFNGHLEQQKLSSNYTEGYLSRALKEQGYESDSNLVFRKRGEAQFAPLSPVEQKQAYRSVQAGGEPPLQGFRKPAPEKPKDDKDIEYYPITPTLTKIRVHDKSLVPQPQKEIICYPITHTSIDRPLDLFAPFPKSVISFVPLNPPPPPPSRHSSRINTALKVFSEVKETKKTGPAGRHEACFQTDYYQRDGPSNKYGTVTIRKQTKREPLVRSKSAGPICSTKTMSASIKEETSQTCGTRVSRKQQSYRVSSSSPGRPASKTDLRKSSPSPVAFGRSISKERTFAEEKKRLEETLPLSRRSFTASTNILRDPSLKSPDEVKIAVRRYAAPLMRSKSAPKKLSTYTPVVRSSSYLSASARKNTSFPGKKEEKSMRMTVSVTPKGRDSNLSQRSSIRTPGVVKSNVHTSSLVEKRTPKQMTKTSSTVSLARTSSTFSVDSNGSKKRASTKKPKTIVRSTSRERTVPVTLQGPYKPVALRDICPSRSDSNVLQKVQQSVDLIQPERIAESIEKEIRRDINDAILQHKDSVRSDKFFQNLFLRDSSPMPSLDSSIQHTTSVQEKTRYWDELASRSEPLSRRSCAYLSQRRPVSDSKFLSLESKRFHQSRSLSPTYRKRSPRGQVLEKVTKFDSYYQLSDEESEFEEPGRAEEMIYKFEQRSNSEPRTRPPVTPITNGSRSTSPVIHDSRDYDYPRVFTPTREVRSPSRRRIESFRESRQSDGTKKVIRASSLSSADERSRRGLYECSEHSHSTSSLNFIERHAPHCRFRNSDRFIDLNRFYNNLERVGQLERATSSTDLRPIRKEGDIIDFDEWRKIRAHEKAEKELNYLVGKLKQDQREKDFLFRPKDIDDIKWREMSDSGLRSKEKSVEDLRESFERKVHEDGLDEAKKFEIEAEKDTYKPFWRGTSVADSASNMVVKYGRDGSRSLDRRFCLSNRLMSTLSKDQVNKIKTQLSEIYSGPPNGVPKEKSEINEDYVITVDEQSKGKVGSLKVRCNSTMSKEDLLGPVLRKKEMQIAAAKAESVVSHSLPPRPPLQSKTFERISKQVSRYETDLSEVEKRKLSQSLSRELHDKVLERRHRGNSPVLVARETFGAVAAEAAKKTLPELPPPPPQEYYSIDYSRSEVQKNERGSGDEKVCEKRSMRMRRSSVGETESNTSDMSKTTVIYKEKPDDGIQTKIKYFEEKKEEEPPKTIYHAREYSSPDEEEILKAIEEKMKAKEREVKEKAEKAIIRHQELSSSASDFKELFGERESSRVNFPLPRPPPPPDEEYQSKEIAHVRRSSLTLSDGTSSCESIYRSRSVSPRLERVTTRCILNKVRTGDVRKIADKFESLNESSRSTFFELGPLRKIRSDPELNKMKRNPHKITIRDHEVGDVSWITHKFEVKNNASRGRSRTRKVTSPIQRVPIRKEDRLMPHIDIISKTAALKHEIAKSKSPSPTIQQPVHTGEVERIRCKFESPDRSSILGQMYTSSPDISELKDISTYLTGSWIAHRYPKPRDNARSPIEPEKGPESETVKRKQTHRSLSTSPPRSKTLVTSILKPYYDIFADQKFDPLIHRPKCRYIPDKVDEIWKKVQNGFRKPNAVKFEENDVVPPSPPTKGVPLYENGHSKESPHRYFETDVNIHYKTPIRYEYKEAIPEEELARKQAETMKKLYQEERRRKYLQELQDMNSRRHTDNFTPSQKSPIPLNRYDDFNANVSPKSPGSITYPRTVARALYNFQGQTARELTFKKGDVIYIRRQIDKNWYEGEHNAMIGLLPANYVEVISKDGVRQPPKKPSEGQARAKFNFQAQSAIELSLNKGELVTLTRRVDENWFEGKIANRKGIFPVSYVEVLTDIGAEDYSPTHIKPVGAPASHSLITYPNTQSLDTLRTNLNNEFNSLTGGQPANGVLRETKSTHKTEVLHVDTNSEPIAYRALYKYRPQNNDELELQEGDIVYVLEKCDDGWYVGTSQRTGYFGTFPGNYVERV